MRFNLEGIFDFGDDNFHYDEKRKILSICSEDFELVLYFVGKFGFKIVRRSKYYKAILRGEKAKEFIENHSIVQFIPL